MKTTIITLASVLYLSSGVAAKNLDSLYSVWQDNSLHDSTRVLAFKDYIVDGFMYIRPDSAYTLAQELIDFSVQKKFKTGQAIGLTLKGGSMGAKGSYSEDIDHQLQALAIFEELRDKDRMSLTLSNIGYKYAQLGDYSKAFVHYERALAIHDQLGNQNGKARVLNYIGALYGDQGEATKALQYFERSLAIAEKTGEQNIVAEVLLNIGSKYLEQGGLPKALLYFERSLAIKEQLGEQKGVAMSLMNIGSIYARQGETSKALEYFGRSLALSERIAYHQGITTSLNNMGTMYLTLEDYHKALEYYERALLLAEKNGSLMEMANSLYTIGGLYLKKGSYPKALEYCSKVLTLAENSGVLMQQKDACNCLYDTYKAMGNDNEALRYLEKKGELDKQLNREGTAKDLQQMEFRQVILQDSIAKAEEARLVREAHQAEVRQKNQTRNIALGSGLFFLLLAGGLFTRVRYIRKSKAVLQEEKDRSENLLLNILPAEIAEELKQKGRADARDFDLVSILFTDFKGFTEASAKLSAQDLVAEINTCFEAFDGIMAKYGIEKIKTIGDAYMAAGGLPMPTDDSVKNTVLAALEMQAFITKRKADNQALGKPAFEMRVGIHSGPVVAGIVGVKKFQYDIWGDTVNTASRMESSGEVGKVNISEATYKLLKDDRDFNFESRGKIEAKGKGEIQMYFIAQQSL